MRRMLPVLAVLWPSLVLAAVLNVEFKFTPYTGDLKEDHVDSVPGTAREKMRAGMTLSVVYPPRLVVVRSPGGTWEVIS